jgi:hypothetical protein
MGQPANVVKAALDARTLDACHPSLPGCGSQTAC